MPLAPSPMVGCTYHITFASINAICQAFDGDPLDWHLGNATLAVVVPIVDLLGEPKVCHTHGHVLVQPAQIGKRNRVVLSAPSNRKPVLPLRHISISCSGCPAWGWGSASPIAPDPEGTVLLPVLCMN